jgi:hypothetical protein
MYTRTPTGILSGVRYRCRCADTQQTRFVPQFMKAIMRQLKMRKASGIQRGSKKKSKEKEVCDCSWSGACARSSSLWLLTYSSSKTKPTSAASSRSQAPLFLSFMCVCVLVYISWPDDIDLGERTH